MYPVKLYQNLQLIYHLCFTCIDFYDLSAWGGCWFVVFIRRSINKFLNVCPFDYTAVAGSVKVGPVNQVNHTSWVVVVTLTDRPKTVRNRCKSNFLWRCLCCRFAFLTILCRGFCHRTESDLFLFLLKMMARRTKYKHVLDIFKLNTTEYFKPRRWDIYKAGNFVFSPVSSLLSWRPQDPHLFL